MLAPANRGTSGRTARGATRRRFARRWSAGGRRPDRADRRTKTASTTLNRAAALPMASDSVSTATAVNTGARRSARMVSRRSVVMVTTTRKCLPVDNILSPWRQARNNGRRTRGLPSTPGRVFSGDALRSSRGRPGGRSFLDSRRPRPERVRDSRRAPRRARMVPRRQVRDVRPLGRVQPARPGRVGDAEPRAFPSPRTSGSRRRSTR